MGKRRRKKLSSTLTWKTVRSMFRLLFQGVAKASPLLFAAVIGFGIFWGIRENLYADSGFWIRTIEVEPKGLLADPLTQELEKRYLNQNLLKVSLASISQKLEEDPQIREARVTRKFPSTLRIEIIRRTPFLQLQFAPRGPYHWVGADGVLIEKNLERNTRLALVEAFEVKGTASETGRELQVPGLLEAISFVKAFGTHALAQSETLERIRIDSLGNVSLILVKGPELWLGRRPMSRLGALQSAIPLLRGPDRDRILYVDLQYQDLVVRKKK